MKSFYVLNNQDESVEEMHKLSNVSEKNEHHQHNNDHVENINAKFSFY